MNINIRGNLYDLSSPRIMGVLNVTPDSFYDGGKHKSVKEILNYVEKMIDDGMDILDVGGYLSDPTKKMIILPSVSAGSTSVVQADNPLGGGLIYNTTLRKLQFHNGTNWETVTSVEVTG